MHYFVTIVYNVTSGNAINLLATGIVSVSILVSKQVLRCQGTTEGVIFLWKTNN